MPKSASQTEGCKDIRQNRRRKGCSETLGATLTPGSPGLSRPHWHPRVCVCSVLFSMLPLHCAQPKHLIKSRFWLLASSVRAQVKRLGCGCYRAQAAPTRQTPFPRLLALVGASLFLGSSPQGDSACFRPHLPGSLVDHSEHGHPPSRTCGQERHFCSSPGTCAGRLDSQALFGSLDITTKPCVPGAPAPEGPEGACSGQGYIRGKQQEPQKVWVQWGSEKGVLTLMQLTQALTQAGRHLDTVCYPS